MTSQEMNKKLCDLDEKQNDKHVFYWGWYWREVDFDDYPYPLATDETRVGFCESNKWGYRYLGVAKAASKNLRALIEKALTTESQNDFKIVNNFMNELNN